MFDNLSSIHLGKFPTKRKYLLEIVMCHSHSRVSEERNSRNIWIAHVLREQNWGKNLRNAGLGKILIPILHVYQRYKTAFCQITANTQKVSHRPKGDKVKMTSLNKKLAKLWFNLLAPINSSQYLILTTTKNYPLFLTKFVSAPEKKSILWKRF